MTRWRAAAVVLALVLGAPAYGKTLAKVGKTVITVEEFKAKIERIPPFYQNRVATPEGRREFLDRIVQDELCYQDALSRGLDKDREFLDQMAAIKRNILASRVKKALLEQGVTVSDDEVRRYYEENRGEFPGQGFDEARGEIERKLENAKRKDALDAYLKALKAKSKIVIDEGALDEIEVDVPPAEPGAAGSDEDGD